jgi:hypothetical protein
MIMWQTDAGTEDNAGPRAKARRIRLACARCQTRKIKASPAYHLHLCLEHPRACTKGDGRACFDHS